MNSTKIEQLCQSSIEAGIKKLYEVGTLPRPPRARNLRLGYDFYRDELEDIQEVNNLLQYLASDNKIKSIYTNEFSDFEIYTLYEYWEQLLLKILRETEGERPTKRVFRKWFSRFLKELYADTAVWRAIDTITGLKLRGTKLNLDKSTALTSTPTRVLKGMIWGEEQYVQDKWLATGLDKAAIITTMTVPKSKYAYFRFPPENLIKSIERHLAAIKAIRLTKPGVPRLHCFAEFQLCNFPTSIPLAYQKEGGEIGLYEKETILDKSDFPIIRDLWRELMATKNKDAPFAYAKPHPMDTAFARFSNTYQRQDWLDHITDLTIALESLFNPTDNEELKHRVSLRAAWLLSTDESVKESPDMANNIIYNRVRDMYDIRSCRVHGGTPKREDIRKWVKTLSGVEYDESKDWKLYELALESARDIVRRAIIACMKLSKLGASGPHFPFPPKFDENIITASQRRIWQKAAGVKRR